MVFFTLSKTDGEVRENKSFRSGTAHQHLLSCFEIPRAEILFTFSLMFYYRSRVGSHTTDEISDVLNAK